jgi:hypothetical protein
MPESDDTEKLLIARDAKAFRDAQDVSRAKLADKEDLTAWNEWLARELELGDYLVETQEESDYRLPHNISNFVPQKMITELEDLFSVARNINNDLAGMRISEAQVVMAGDSRALAIAQELRTWAHNYVELRADKAKHRSGGPMTKFKYLYYELLPDLEKVIYTNKTVNRCFFSEFTDYLPWLIFQKYCAHLLEVRFDQFALETFSRINSKDDVERIFLTKILQLYQWHRAGNLSHVLSLLDHKLPKPESSPTTDQMLAKLERLAAEIAEMRPFLVHNFKPENILIEIAPGMIISWFWAVGIGEGLVWIAPTIESMLKQQRAKTSYLTLLLNYDGLLTGYVTPWLSVDALVENKDRALYLNLQIVEAIHAKLLSFYAKVDVQAIRDRYKKNQTTKTTSEPTLEEFAAICQTIAEPLDQNETTSEPTTFGAIRSQRLFSILAKNLNCEVRQGKGSEIVIYREGGHHFRLGHHKRNSYVPTPIIRNLLRHVGIDMQEWMAALT